MISKSSLFFVALFFSSLVNSEIIIYKLFESELGFETGEIHVGGDFSSHYVKFTKQSSNVGFGAYNIATEIHDAHLAFELVGSSKSILLGNCNPSLPNCYLTATSIDNTPKIDAAKNYPSNLKVFSKPKRAFARLNSLVNMSYKKLKYNDNTQKHFNFKRTKLSGWFEDQLVFDKGEWKLTSAVNGDIYVEEHFKEDYRTSTHIFLAKKGLLEGEKYRLKIPLRGGCERFHNGSEWYKPADLWPFSRINFPASSSVFLDCDKGNVLPQSCYSSTAIGPQCTFYSNCVESRQLCGASGYALGYGNKYCNRFIAGAFSGNGKKWRDATLICLQEELVSTVLLSDSTKSCSEISDIAFDSHPSCYTENGSGISICDFDKLSSSDYKAIFGILDFDDLLTPEGKRQVGDVMKICVASKTSEDQWVNMILKLSP